MEIFLVLLASVVGVFLHFCLPSIKGKWGEVKVAGILSLLPDNEYKVLHDIVIQSNGYTSQIDHIVVSVYGIFVIETKNYKGWITGFENSKQWTQNVYGNKYSLYNPIKQNKSHILALKNELYIIEDNFIPIIAFSNDCSLKIETETPVIYISQILNEIKRHTEVKFDKTQLDGIVERIKAINIDSPEMQQQHIDEIKYHKQQTEYKLQQGICPRCGALLVLRQGRYGKFYGCSNYPRCHYTHSDQ